ncbi:MAG: enoyl-CoA hydratase/isomerase family protein [Spirochaetes bacterium]|nr:enoyl-CoA hydratase/isomerase family protein [Spirochaetota bacterium]
MRRLTEEVIPLSDVTGIVIYGEGRHFSSGADLDDLISAIKGHGKSDLDQDRSSILSDNLRSFTFFENLTIPVVAAIRGVCLGSALELALFCHCRICGNGSVLGLPESTFGLIPGCGGISNMASLAGLPRTMELVLSGSSFTSEEAHQWKIVDKIVPKKDVVTAAINFIKFIPGRYNRLGMNSYIYDYMR